MYIMLNKINEAFNENPHLELSFNIDKSKATVYIKDKGAIIEKQFDRESIYKDGNAISSWLGGLQL